MYTKSTVAASLLGLVGVHAQNCPASCQTVADFSNQCSVPISATANAAWPIGWGGLAGFAPWSGFGSASDIGSWFGGLGGSWKKRDVSSSTVPVATNALNCWSTTANINTICANKGIYDAATECVKGCTDLPTLYYSSMVLSNCNGLVSGWKKRRSADPAVKKRQTGASWTGSGSPPSWWGTGSGGTTGGSTGGTGTGGSAPAAVPAAASHGVAPAAVAPTPAAIPAAIPASVGSTPQGLGSAGNELLFAGAPKLSHGLAYVVAAGLATSIALLI